MTTILVGTDTSAAADIAVEDAAKLARESDAELVVLYVRSDKDLHSAVDFGRAADPNRHLAKLTERYQGVRATARVETGEPADRLVAVAEELQVDTIVIGNRGTQGAWWRVKDSVPNLVLRHAPCSVYIVDTRRAQ